jgi:hypothetical protein
MIAARTDDGRFGPSQWVPNPAPGHWSPQVNAAGQLVLDPTPWVGGVKPFVMRSSSQFRTVGPLALNSAAWAKEFNEVKAIGEVDSATRTDDQTYIARWWQSNPVKSWNEVGRDLAERHGLGTLETARLLALQNLSGGDAAINCWDDKYYWDFWRPWNAIQRAAEDGNPWTAPQADWLPLIAAPYPDHPSGHLCLDSAHATILRMYFGDAPRGGFIMTSASTLITPQPPAARSFTSFTQVLDEVTEARIWAGLHYRNADNQARGLGERVAWYAVTHALQPPPLITGRSTHHQRDARRSGADSPLAVRPRPREAGHQPEGPGEADEQRSGDDPLPDQLSEQCDEGVEGGDGGRG